MDVCHDGAAMHRFVLLGALTGACVDELEHAWTTAATALNGNGLVVDISGLTSADQAGLDLLSRMRTSGVRFTAPTPPVSRNLMRSLGIPAASGLHPVRQRALRRLPSWLLQFLSLSG